LRLSDDRTAALARTQENPFEESEHTPLFGACAACRIAAPGDYDARLVRCCIVLLG